MVFLYNLLDLKRTTWEGPELSAGKHTIVFDFKSDGPGLGKGGTGVLSVDGKEVARNSMEHTTPITFPEDETFDVGQDTRTGVALLEYRYDPPFKFTGKINKLTFKLEPEQRSESEALAAVYRATESRARNGTGVIGTMKKVLIFAAVAEVATGLALLIVPSLVGQLLLGEQLTGVAIPVARVAGIALIALGIACWPGPPLVGMLTYSTIGRAVSCLSRFRRWFDRRPSVAGGRPSRDPDRTFNLGICKREKNEHAGKQNRRRTKFAFWRMKI